MRVRGLPVILIVSVAFAVTAYVERDLIQDLLGGHSAHGDRLAYAFDGPVAPADLEKARVLLARAVSSLPAEVRIDGQQIVIDVQSVDSSFTAYAAVEHLLATRPHLKLRVVDYESDYLEALAKYSRGSKAASDLAITAELDSIGRYLSVPSDGKYVNEAWARAHDCKLTDRIVGTGIYCWITPRDRIQAYFNGDPGLFVDPIAPAVAIPADRDLIPDTGDRATRSTHAWKYYLVERAPIILDATTVSYVMREDHAALIELTPRGRELIAARAGAPTAEVVALADGQLRPVQIERRDNGTVALRIAVDPAITDSLTTGLAIVALPRKLEPVRTRQ